MARSEVVTLIPLDTAAEILGIDALHFNMIITTRHPENTACDDVWMQDAWQRMGQASRDDLARALYQAEQEVVRYLGYYPMPTWIDSEEQRVAKPYAVELRNVYSRNSRGQYKSIRAKYGHVLETGRRAKTLIQAGAAIVYSDADGDGYNEKATVTVATALTDPQEIRVYFPSESGDDSWEIRPADVTISGGNAVITFKKWQVPLPSLWTKSPPESDPVWRAIDGDNIANFLTTVDVYRVYTDVSTQATLYHEDSTCGSCGGSGCNACDFDTETACMRIRESRLGLLSYTPATWDDDTDQFDFSGSCCFDPDKIIFHYRAGLYNNRLKAPYKMMDPEWERSIVYYAVTLMDRAENICGNFQNVRMHMTEDLALREGNRSYIMSFKSLQNPLGTTRAAINLWRKIEKERLL